MTPPRERTITLTDQPPVRICEREWPVIGRATEPDGVDIVHHLTVRRHYDQRTLVYAVRCPALASLALASLPATTI